MPCVFWDRRRMSRGAPRPEDKSEHTKEDRHQSPDLHQHMVTRPRVTSVPNPTPHRTIRYRPAARQSAVGGCAGEGVLVRSARGCVCPDRWRPLLLLLCLPPSPHQKKKSVFYDATRPLLRPFLQMHVISTQKKKEDPFRGAWCFPAKKKKRDPKQTKTGILHTPALEGGIDR